MTMGDNRTHDATHLEIRNTADVDVSVRDGILTLPAALAVRDPRTAALFGSSTNGTQRALRRKFTASLPEAEEYLDGVAAEAAREARDNTREPKILLRLIQHTRRLSR